MQIQFNEKNHRYFYEEKIAKNGKPKVKKIWVPSVTTILDIINKPALIPWAVKTTVNYMIENYAAIGEDVNPMQIFADAKQAHKNIKNKAAETGTKIHKAIQSFFLDEKIDIDSMNDEGRSAYSAFLDWANQNSFECKDTEIRLYNKTDVYAGTCDAVGEINGETVLLDWKTGSGIYPEAILQVAAYARAYTLINVEFISKAYIVRFGKNNDGFEVRMVNGEELSQAYETFLAAKSIYNWKRKK